ncbi:zymogen granule protein 16 homolog B-like [Camelus ferus]|uniref:Zymogen granule protein 16 homolog B-like n=2 Tax=Camelus TaxID=9836 RepID=A0A8B7KEV5_CAMFR|nr:zymogen granule protein 16 homolog B [Camelus bactrianus]XP_014418285.2 zymogen granule protein 16 homolog B-like [Camelus ferus]
MEGGPGTARIPSAGTRPQDSPGQELLTPQLETMLLWLTLALLWSSSCWAGQTYGPGGGWYFSTSKDNANEITGIRVCIGAVGIVKSIQVRYGSSWSERYGVAGGTCQEFLLQPGEHITAVYGSYRLFLRYLLIYTDQNNWTVFGENGGRNFFALPDGSEKVLTGIFGQYKLLGISSIGFEWDYPLVEVTTVQPFSAST